MELLPLTVLQGFLSRASTIRVTARESDFECLKGPCTYVFCCTEVPIRRNPFKASVCAIWP